MNPSRGNSKDLEQTIVSTAQTSQLSGRERSNRLHILNRGIDEALNQIGDLHQQQLFTLKTMSEKILELAYMVRDLNALSDKPMPENTICATVTKLFHDRGIEDKDRLIRWALRNTNFRRPVEQDADQQGRVIKSSLEADVETFISAANSVLTESQDQLLEQTDPSVIERLNPKKVAELRDRVRYRTERLGVLSKELRKLQRVLGDQSDMYQTRCDQLGIALDPDSVEAEKDVTRSQPIISGYSEFYTATEEFIELWKRILEKIMKYKPLTDKMAHDLAEVMRLQIEMDKPLADEKFRADRLQWILNGANEAYRGKHAAAEMYCYMLPKKTIKELKELNEDILSIAVDPEGNSHLDMEKVTIVREQMGDVKEALERLAGNIIAVIPKYTATITWFAHHQGWSIAKRKQEVHPKLSNAA